MAIPETVELRGTEDIARLLGSGDFLIVDYANRHRALADHFGLDFSNIIFAIQHVPLCLMGAEHAASRKRIATLMAEGSADAVSFIQNDIAGMVAKLHAPGPHDVMQEFVHPCVNGLLAASTGITSALGHDPVMSQIFSQTAGIAKRKRMNAELGKLRETIASQRPDLNETEIGDRVALFILGTDALKGTLARSIHALYIQSGGKVPTTFMEEYPATGVPYIQRLSEVACPFDGVISPENTHFSARLDEFERPENASFRNRFFGYGAHLCLGRKLSVLLWKVIQEAMHDFPAEIDITDYALRKDDVFNIPKTFQIEVKHA